MFDKELYTKTFSKLKASDDTLMEVMKMTVNRKRLFNRTNKSLADSSQQVPRSTIRRVAVIATVMILALSLAANVFAYGGEIITYIQSDIFGMALSQDAVKGYSLVNEIGKFLAVNEVVDGETMLNHRGYVFSLDEIDGKYTLQNVAFDNGEMILIKPGNANGFSLKKGESISLYAKLNTSPRYADKAGELSQVGCYINGDVYETFTGKLANGGVVFTIVAPVDGEYMIYLTNYCATLQNYVEISVY